MDEPRLKIGDRINRLLRVHHSNPDIARRGQLLNILLLGIGLGASAGFVVGLIFSIADGWTHQDEILLVVVCAIAVVFVSFLYLLNRSSTVRLAPVVFLLGLIVLISLSDEPQYLVAGRSTMVFVLPIIMASVLMRPAASFVMATLSSIAVVVLALVSNLDLGPLYSTLPVEVIQFFVIALVGWLAARGLENALADQRKANRELDQLNRELDQRVAARTKELAEALINVQLESGKSHAILESIADGVIVFDESGKASVTNPAISQLLDRPPDKLLGYTIDELMEGKAELGDNTQRMPNLKFQWGSKTVSASFAPVQMSGEGTSGGVVAVFRDFTREAELERMKSAFVSMVSHELRTPLSAIIGYSEMLRESVYGALNEKQVGVIGRLHVNAKRLLSLVNDLLDRAQLEAGKMMLRLSVFSPATALIDELLPVVSEQVKAKGLELITQIAEDVPAQVVGDPQRLLQILINLVTNSLKFTEKGSIRVDISRPDMEHWRLAVADTGIGIPANEQPYIFESFRQVDGTATRQHAGFGLGLSIVKQLVVLMGGEISVLSQVGQGSTFAVTLPLVVQMPEEKTA